MFIRFEKKKKNGLLFLYSTNTIKEEEEENQISYINLKKKSTEVKNYRN